MKKVMIAAMESGSGKTVFTCGLIRALSKRGYEVSAFKCGPDYIDPMYLKAASGNPCRNLDIFLQGQEGVRKTFGKCPEDGFAVIEAAMGYYDGLNNTDEASAYHVAHLLDVPVVLLVRPGKNSLTLAAEINGLLGFRQPSKIVGVFLVGCSKKRFGDLKTVIEQECGIDVFGFMPHIPEAEFSSRHLGLFTADEVVDLSERIDKISAALEENVDVHHICSLG